MTPTADATPRCPPSPWLLRVSGVGVQLTRRRGGAAPRASRTRLAHAATRPPLCLAPMRTRLSCSLALMFSRSHVHRRDGVFAQAALREQASFVASRLGVSSDVDGMLRAAEQLGLVRHTQRTRTLHPMQAHLCKRARWLFCGWWSSWLSALLGRVRLTRARVPAGAQATDGGASGAQLGGALVAALGAAEVGEQAAHLPSSLEPDAPFVEGKRLDSQDEQSQGALLHALWQLVRAGSVPRAQQLCRRCGQSWRAATLGGGEPWRYDPSVREWVGNPQRELWRSACDAISARAAKHSEMAGAGFEAALYGALAASESALPRVLAACSGWEDTMWAHLNAALHSHVARLTAHYAALATAAPTPTPPPMRLPAAALHAALEHATSSAAADPQSARPHHALQRKLVGARLAQLPAAAAWRGGGAAIDARAAGGAGVALDDGVGVGIPPSAATPAAEGGAWPHDEDVAFAALLATMHAVSGGASTGGVAPDACASSARERAHLLRFGAHAALFLYLPLLATRTRSALPSIATWRELLTGYCGVLGGAAAALAAPTPPTPAPSSLGLYSFFGADVAAGGLGAGLRMSGVGGGGGGGAPIDEPTLEELSGAVALIASNLCVHAEPPTVMPSPMLLSHHPHAIAHAEPPPSCHRPCPALPSPRCDAASP
jgi:hypothetical protein